MTQSAHVSGMMDALSEQAPAHTADTELISRFVSGVGRQIRAAHHTRFTASELLTQVMDLWQLGVNRTDSAPYVKMEVGGGRFLFTSIMKDQPFIVDTIRMALISRGATNLAGLNVVIGIGRDDDGNILRVDESTDTLESLVRIEGEGIEAADSASLRSTIEGRLRLAQAMTQSFRGITDLVDSASYRFSRLSDRFPDQADDLRETAEFLRWLLADNFVFMGAISGDRRLGMCRVDVADVWQGASLETWPTNGTNPGVRVRKGSTESPVHRAGRVDEIRIEVPDLGTGPAQVILLQGLFTYRAVTQPSRHVPVLRRVLRSLLATQDSQPGSYRYKGIANVFDSHPTEFLFTATPAQTTAMIERVLEAEVARKARVHIMQSDEGDTTFVVAAMPRASWNDQLRALLENFLVKSTDASYSDHGIFVGRYETMLVHYFLTGTRALDAQEREQIHAWFQTLATPWQDALHMALRERFPEGSTADELLTRYGSAFEDLYVRMTTPVQAAHDIELLEQLETQGGVLVDLYEDTKDRINVRIYQAEDIILSDILPVLDDFGLKVTDQFADPVQVRPGVVRSIDTFRLQGVDGLSGAAVLDRADLLVKGLQAVLEGVMPGDGLNRILLPARIPWMAVDVLRAYLGYARQLSLTYSTRRVEEILLAYPELTASLWEFFSAKFDPGASSNRKDAMGVTSEAVIDALRDVRDNESDRVFRTLHNLIDSSVRTNFYQTGKTEHYISFKVRCADVTHMPSPRMMFEIYVHHPAVEGVHLRGGKVARGGLRWSDREDYRREILDLVSTQMVKNVLIVPEGAKGGFFLKSPLKDRAERRAAADTCYQVFIRGLLDVTDNIVNGKIVHPEEVVRHDEDDPYLVVAADKGTAHLSDTANGISSAMGFWMDDAFASGGSNGYDHKAVGITARGGWVLTRRHFAELGVDPRKDEFTCIGIGDPSGDVFGNGVIEHSTMKLVAAFNHLHIFLDPNPDPAASHAERTRLFRAGQGWAHYDSAKLSPGGGIFDRKAKSIKLSPEIQKLLGVLKDELPVETILRILLRMNVDLLWNGGIGTYVKASYETQSDAGDPANDHIRVSADELRCKIVGEGGNLGFTQEGRIEFAQQGGKINTDAIDNSGGVDMSDHEVNLKILLRPVVEDGELSIEERNVLLKRLTDEVADLVLANSNTHGLQLSLDERRARTDPMAFSRAIDCVSQAHKRSLAELHLPNGDALLRRAAAGQGITRPELAVLAAHVKMLVYQALMEADPATIPDFDGRVLRYFPVEIQERFADRIAKHMLHKSIGMTVVTTEVMVHAGATFFSDTAELTGASTPEIAAAWYQAMDLINGEKLLQDLADCDVPRAAKYKAWTQATDAITQLVALWLTPGEPGPQTEDKERIAEVLSRLGKAKGTNLEARIRARRDPLITRGIPEALANRIGLLGELSSAREIALSHKKGGRLSHSLVRYMAVAEASHILTAIAAMDARTAEGGWDPAAVGILRARYVLLLRDLIEAVDVGAQVRLGIDRVAMRLSLDKLKNLQSELAHVVGENPSLAALMVGEQRVCALVAALNNGS